LYTPKWSNHIFDEWKDMMHRKGVSPEESEKRTRKVTYADYNWLRSHPAA
jgi:hypothetical protein